MTTVEDIDGYFRSLNSITRKIWNDKENVKNSFGEESWNRLSEDEQAELFNKYIIDDSIRQKYVNVEKEETPEMFPMMKINCGELIAADNQNDNLITWRDEHSGPFSWMTRSQQDLTLADCDIPTDQTKHDGREDSPSLEHDSGHYQYHQTVHDVVRRTIAKADSALDEFSELSLKFLSRKMDDNEKDEELSVITGSTEEVSSAHYENYFTDSDDNLLLVDSPSSSSRGQTKDSISSCVTSDNGTQKVSATGNKKRSSKAKEPKSEAEFCLIDEKLDYNGSYGEQVSPVFVEDFRESISGQTATGFLFPDISLQFGSSPGLEDDSAGQDLLVGEPFDEKPVSDSVICVQPTSASVLDATVNLNCTASNDDGADKDDDQLKTTKPTISSGFDFLDNW
ncbi:hypothetical protein LSH36_587g01022 [Paralvinella palmiformis]|uniref:DUF4706 domain-containing protein n=1 Tax=Paralvinella palmiformis TaxID=53620 RepID=A0AAD9J6T8_9ANNE|nr:hypothetical protein LSH36_587g01022 [Paralvinella palmiformis]